MEDPEKTLPVSETLTEAESSAVRRSGNEYCLNCGTKLLDSYCHHCGQKDLPRRQTLGELWINFISSFWSYEGKFFVTTRYLITKPGFLAMEYNAGRRERYFHPARMYVFISFVFFLLFVSLPDDEKGEDEGNLTGPSKPQTSEQKAHQVDSALSAAFGGDSTLSTIRKAVRDSISRKDMNVKLQEAEYRSVKEYDSAQSLKPADERDGWFKRNMTIREIELNNRYRDKPDQFQQDFVSAFKDNFSRILFFLLPVFALLLKLLYIRRDYFYSEHLVFSIYYYNFFFLGGSMVMLADLFSPGWVITLINLWIYLYLLAAMKRMYQQSWRKTIAKFILLSSMFFLCMTFALVVAALVFLMVI